MPMTKDTDFQTLAILLFSFVDRLDAAAALVVGLAAVLGTIGYCFSGRMPTILVRQYTTAAASEACCGCFSTALSL